MIRRPPRSTLFPTRRSSDLHLEGPSGAKAVRRPDHLSAAGARRPGVFGGQPHECAELGPDSAQYIPHQDRKSTRLNSSHSQISYAVFCLKKKKSYTQSLVLI